MEITPMIREPQIDRRETRGPGAPEGNQNASKEKTTVDNVNICPETKRPNGNSRQYKIRRLRKAAEQLQKCLIVNVYGETLVLKEKCKEEDMSFDRSRMEKRIIQLYTPGSEPLQPSGLGCLINGKVLTAAHCLAEGQLERIARQESPQMTVSPFHDRSRCFELYVNLFQWGESADTMVLSAEDPDGSSRSVMARFVARPRTCPPMEPRCWWSSRETILTSAPSTSKPERSRTS